MAPDTATMTAMRPHRTPLFFSLWQRIPHAPFNRAVAAVMQARWPQPVIRRVVKRWTERAGIVAEDFVGGPHDTLEAFFLRKLRDGARPIGEGFVSPVDGRVMAKGRIEAGTLMQVKGSPYSLTELCGSGFHGFDPAPFEGGDYVTIFLSPDGYHHVHHPDDGVVHALRWLPGCYLPQNVDAVQHIDGIYVRNERLVLDIATERGRLLLVMVAASLVGGIHLEDWPQSAFMAENRVDPRVVEVVRRSQKGSIIGHFAFGSTVVLVGEPGVIGVVAPAVGAMVRMGQSLVTS